MNSCTIFPSMVIVSKKPSWPSTNSSTAAAAFRGLILRFHGSPDRAPRRLSDADRYRKRRLASRGLMNHRVTDLLDEGLEPRRATRRRWIRRKGLRPHGAGLAFIAGLSRQRNEVLDATSLEYEQASRARVRWASMCDFDRWPRAGRPSSFRVDTPRTASSSEGSVRHTPTEPARSPSSQPLASSGSRKSTGRSPMPVTRGAVAALQGARELALVLGERRARRTGHAWQARGGSRGRGAFSIGFVAQLPGVASDRCTDVVPARWWDQE